MSVKGVEATGYSATFEQEEDAGMLVFVCRGQNGCGAMFFAEDRQRHADHHAETWGRLASLEASSG